MGGGAWELHLEKLCVSTGATEGSVVGFFYLRSQNSNIIKATYVANEKFLRAKNRVRTGYSKCTGSRPSQLIKSYFICDGKFDCIDRSDESLCKSKREGSFVTVPTFAFFGAIFEFNLSLNQFTCMYSCILCIFAVLNKYANFEDCCYKIVRNREKITEMEFNKDLLDRFALPVELPLQRPADFEVSGGLYEECHDRNGTFGVVIDGHCFKPHLLCNGPHTQSENGHNLWGVGSLSRNLKLRFHPQHISICKNLTFWQGIWDDEVVLL